MCSQTLIVTDLAPPALVPIGDKTVPEQTLLTFTASVATSNSDGRTFIFSLDPGAPAGASIDPSTGVFTWIPTEAQGPSTNSVTVRVTDSCIASLTTTETIQIVVTEVNLPPVLAPIPHQTVDLGHSVTFTATATDPDLPPQTLTFTLGPGASSGAHIDPLTGVFTWTPGLTQGVGDHILQVIVSDNGVGDHILQVIVSDNGVPSLSATQAVTITVTGGANLMVAVHASPEPAYRTQPLTYLLSVSNAGPATAVGATLTNWIPSGATLVSATPGSNAIGSTVIWYSLGDMPAGASTNITVVVRPGVVGLITNFTSVASLTPELDSSDNIAAHVSVVLEYGPGLSIFDTMVTERDSGFVDAVFPVRLSATSTQSITVHFATADGTALAGQEYVATNGTLIFPPGTTNRSVHIAVKGDKLSENTEIFYVVLSSPTNAHLVRDQAVGTIRDNNDAAPTISITDVVVTEGDTAPVDAVFKVRLSGPSGKIVTVKYATAPGTAHENIDYVASSGTVTFPPGIVEQPIVVSVLPDLLDEFDETFYVN
jgi:uncharacterized repeat protein (TIGR01451 family)